MFYRDVLRKELLSLLKLSWAAACAFLVSVVADDINWAPAFSFKKVEAGAFASIRHVASILSRADSVTNKDLPILTA